MARGVVTYRNNTPLVFMFGSNAVYPGQTVDEDVVYGYDTSCLEVIQAPAKRSKASEPDEVEESRE